MRVWGVCACLLGWTGLAHARVFNFKDAGVAAYVRGTGGLSLLNQDAFANSSGVGTQLHGKSNYDYGGELGFMFAPNNRLHVRFGAELIDQHPVNTTGLDASGNSLFVLNSTVFVFNPNVTFEYIFSSDADTRIFGELGIGYATASVTNTYQMTAAGTSALGPTDFKESLTGSGVSSMIGLGMECLFTDSVTFLADLNYRYMPIKSMTYASDVNNIVSPSGVSKGSRVVNQDGSIRKLNLSGLYAGIAFRFYMNFF